MTGGNGTATANETHHNDDPEMHGSSTTDGSYGLGVNSMWLLFVAWTTASSARSTITGADWQSVISSWDLINSVVIMAVALRAMAKEGKKKKVSTQKRKKADEEEQIWRGGTDQPWGIGMVCSLFPTFLYTVSSVTVNQQQLHGMMRCLPLISAGSLQRVVEQKQENPSSWLTSNMFRLVISFVMVTSAFSVALDTAIIKFLGFYAIAFVELFQSIYLSVSMLHEVWTFGEWALVVGLLTLLLVHHCTFEDRQEQEQHWIDETNAVYVVSRAGFLGALLCCPMAHIVWPSPLHVEFEDKTNGQVMEQGKSQSGQNISKTVKYWFHQNSLWLKVGTSVVLILSFVELHFWPWGRRQDDNHPVFAEFPQCLWWLIRFLGQVERSCFLPRTTDEFEIIPFSSLPRYYWLVYWVVALAVTLVGVPSLLEPLVFPRDNAQQRQYGKEDSLSSSSTLPLTSIITLKRKWFHWVAVLVFGPVTLFAPQLQALGYTIALAILVSVEGVQVRQHMPSMQAFFATFLDPRKNEGDNCSGSKVIVSHMGLIAGCAMPLYLALYLLEINNLEKEEQRKLLCLSLSMVGIVGLGVGDAMAAVSGTLYSWWKKGKPSVQRWEDFTGLSRWGRLNRTWMGSLSMLLSMYVFVRLLDQWFRSFQQEGADEENYPGLGEASSWWPTLLWMTTVEAYTSQLDNLVLPVVGMTVFLQSHMLQFSGEALMVEP